jgi:hypothetical protein
MGDAYRRYRVIGDALKKSYPEEPRGRMAHHLNIDILFDNQNNR